MWRTFRLLVPAVALSLTLTGTAPGAENYRARFWKASAAHDEKTCQTVLDEWKRASPDDPEYCIAAANDVLNRGAGVVISTKKSAPGDLVVADQKTGREVGSISPGKPSPDNYKQATELLKHGLTFAPERIDIYLGLAVVDENTGQSKALLDVLNDMAAYAKAHPTALKYKDGKPYPEPAEKHLALAINAIASRYFNRANPENNQVFHDLAKLDADRYPNEVYGHNLLGIYYTVVDKQPALALASYERALKIVPDDSYVWMNVGLLQAQAGDKKKAADAFNTIVSLHNDASCVEQARSELAKLK